MSDHTHKRTKKKTHTSNHANSKHSKIVRTKKKGKKKQMPKQSKVVRRTKKRFATRLPDPQPVPIMEPISQGLQTDILPEFAQDFCHMIADTQEVPIHSPVMVCMAALASLVQGHFVAHVRRGFKEQLPLYTAVLLGSGEKKSPTQNAILEPLREIDKEVQRAWEAKFDEVESHKAVIEQQIKIVQRKIPRNAGKAEQKRFADEICKLRQSMIVHPRTQLIAEDFTEAALVDVLKDSDERILVASDEGALLENLKGRFGNKSGEYSLFLKAHDGTEFKFDRRSDNRRITLETPLISTTIAFQPEVMAATTQTERILGNGLVQRFLWTKPEPKAGRREFNSIPFCSETHSVYCDAITQIYKTLERNTQCHQVRLTTDAQIEHAVFEQYIDRLMRPAFVTGHGAIKGWCNKLPGQAVRIATIKVICEHIVSLSEFDPESIVVDASDMKAAIQFCKQLIPHARDAISLLEGGSTTALQKVLDHFSANGWPTGDFCSNHIFKKVRSKSVKRCSNLDPVIQILLEHKYLFKTNPSGKSGPTTQYYRANECLPPAME
ncbi:DUF3987 domain-containing protein [Planctomycetota bacterium]|nr:DUF3987 domain-containing protein [Planctomycetota bacterium]